MYKLLLVDDEAITCETIKNIIPWQTYQISQVEIASNGLEALSLFEQYEPDIIVTDIRMPKMDGMEFIEKVRELDSSCRVIVITGFTDKEYLKAAIKFRVSAFVEKPLIPNEVIDAISIAVQELDEENIMRDTHANSDENHIKSHAVRTLIERNNHNDDHLKTSINQLKRLNCDLFSNGQAVVMIIKLYWDTIILVDEQVTRCREVINRLNTEFEDIPLIADMHSLNTITAIGLFSNTDDKTSTQAFDTLHKYLSRQLDNLAIVTFACGIPVSIANDINTSYESALIAMNNLFYIDDESVCCDYSNGFSYDPGINIYGKYRDILKRNNLEEIDLFYQSLLEEVLFHKDQNINSVKNIFFNLMIVLLEYTIRTGNDNILDSSDKPYVWMHIQRARNIYELGNFIKALTQSYLEDEFKKNSSYKINQISAYIEENYTDKSLTMEQIARHLNYSTTYISNLFKNETGSTLIEYTTNLRVEKAKDLLKTTPLKVYDIADKAGFYDSNYFSTVFKRIVGCTPSKYRGN